MRAAMTPDEHALQQARAALWRAYGLHLAWFAIMCAFVAWHWHERGLQFSVLLTLLTVPPVLRRTVKVHRLSRALDPRARTLGWGPVLLVTLVLSPFESGLVLPLKNLWVSRRLLARAAAARTSDDAAAQSRSSITSNAATGSTSAS